MFGRLNAETFSSHSNWNVSVECSIVHATGNGEWAMRNKHNIFALHIQWSASDWQLEIIVSLIFFFFVILLFIRERRFRVEKCERHFVLSFSLQLKFHFAEKVVDGEGDSDVYIRMLSHDESNKMKVPISRHKYINFFFGILFFFNRLIAHV